MTVGDASLTASNEDAAAYLISYLASGNAGDTVPYVQADSPEALEPLVESWLGALSTQARSGEHTLAHSRFRRVLGRLKEIQLLRGLPDLGGDALQLRYSERCRLNPKLFGGTLNAAAPGTLRQMVYRAYPGKTEVSAEACLALFALLPRSAGIADGRSAPLHAVG